jgi:hypothetical protein
MKKDIKIILFIFAVVFFLAAPCQAVLLREISVDYQGQPQKVTYDIYVPSGAAVDASVAASAGAPVPAKPLPVVVCVGGLPSGPDECRTPEWKRFADENGVALLGLGFTFIPQDWPKQESYQFPQAWSGKALLEILDILSKEVSINPKELYFYGVSAGAQFSIRFAQMKPFISKAVAAHAAGSYDTPLYYIPTRFLITVGQLDNREVRRLKMAKEFAAAADKKDIAVSLKVVPEIAHRQTEEQNEMSRQFFKQVLKGERPPRPEPELKQARVGMSEEGFWEKFPLKEARTYRGNETEHWVTFSYPKKGRARDAVTFHLVEGKVVGWAWNDRDEVIEEYLSEFCSSAFLRDHPRTHEAIKSALKVLPHEVFLSVTERARPVIFTEYHKNGMGSFANSSEIITADGEPPAFMKGMTLIKLSTDLENGDTLAIEGIVLHELTHRVLEHSKRKPYSCKFEREANRLVKAWGKEEAFLKAKELFGAEKTGEVVKCEEE